VVAEGVVDQLDQLARSCHGADVAAAAGRDPIAVGSEPGVGAEALHGLDRGPADQPAALFGDPATAHGRVGLVMLWRQPRLAGQLCRAAEAVDIADLGDKHCGEHRAHTGNGLHCGIAEILM
jgi:hypothetical protein